MPSSATASEGRERTEALNALGRYQRWLEDAVDEEKRRWRYDGLDPRDGAKDVVDRLMGY